MFISTLPSPKHTIQCQESSGQIFKCTFIVDKHSNGNRIIAITVYVPANFVVSGTESFRIIKVTVSIHTTYTNTTTISTAVSWLQICSIYRLYEYLASSLLYILQLSLPSSYTLLHLILLFQSALFSFVLSSDLL